jgi:hypothetical protein
MPNPSFHRTLTVRLGTVEQTLIVVAPTGRSWPNRDGRFIPVRERLDPLYCRVGAEQVALRRLLPNR